MAFSHTPPASSESVDPASTGSAGLLARFFGQRDDEARVTLVASTYAARAALAFAVLALAAAHLDPSAGGATVLLDLGPDGMSIREALVGLLFLLAIATAVQITLGLAIHLRRGQVPTAGHLTFGATLDVLWLVTGYIASGHSGIPFPPLLVLALGIHGVLLSAGRTMYVAALTCVLFVFAHTLGVVVRDPAFSAETQVALFVGIGLVSAIVGNRIRAAGWAIERLGRAVEGLARHHQQVLDHLPVGILAVEPGAVHANTRAFDLADAPVSRGDEELLQLLRSQLSGLDGDVVVALDTSDPSFPRTGEGTLENGRQLAWTVVPREVPETEGLSMSALSATTPSSPERDASTEPAPATKRVVLIALHDVTAHREAERMRFRAERYEAIAELSAGLAHEVRNPVAALRLSAEQLSEADLDDPEDRNLVEIILREARRLNRLATEFLEYARVGGGDPSRFVVPDLISEAIDAVGHHAPDATEDVTFQIDAPDVAVRADAELVYRVLVNLLLNAAAFSPRPGTVEVRAHADRDDGNVELSVRDHGPGIAPADRDRVFRPFYTTRRGGSGLGLALAARAATLLSGELAAETPPDSAPTGEGVLFRLRFPAAPSGA